MLENIAIKFNIFKYTLDFKVKMDHTCELTILVNMTNGMTWPLPLELKLYGRSKNY